LRFNSVASPLALCLAALMMIARNSGGGATMRRSCRDGHQAFLW
jgi:hypothetical protein